jgi:hypothetical protein
VSLWYFVSTVAVAPTLVRRPAIAVQHGESPLESPGHRLWKPVTIGALQTGQALVAILPQAPCVLSCFYRGGRFLSVLRRDNGVSYLHSRQLTASMRGSALVHRPSATARVLASSVFGPTRTVTGTWLSLSCSLAMPQRYGRLGRGRFREAAGPIIVSALPPGPCGRDLTGIGTGLESN